MHVDCYGLLELFDSIFQYATHIVTTENALLLSLEMRHRMLGHSYVRPFNSILKFISIAVSRFLRELKSIKY